jgi:zinc finger MYND domain-containing protein 10
MDSLIQKGFVQAKERVSTTLLEQFEAERIVEGLRVFELSDIGSTGWLQQQESVEKLNLQGHYNASTHSDEFIKDLLVSYDKVNTVVHEVLLMEVFRERVIPHAKAALASEIDSISSYLVVFHEANVANLFELVLFDNNAIAHVEEEYLLELLDWCSRQLHYLNTDAFSDAQYEQRNAQVRAPVKALGFAPAPGEVHSGQCEKGNQRETMVESHV